MLFMNLIKRQTGTVFIKLLFLKATKKVYNSIIKFSDNRIKFQIY